MKKLIFLLLLPLITVKAQPKCKLAIIRSSADYRAGKYDENLQKIRHALWSDSVIVCDKKSTTPCDPGRIWGVRDKDCAIYRNYDQEFYQIDQADSIVVYIQTINPFRDFPFTFYFFSKNLDSPIYKLTRKNLEKEFGSNTCFMQELDKKIKWFEDYSAIDLKKNVYKIVEIYRDCVRKK
jgi:outer membrane pore protein E